MAREESVGDAARKLGQKMMRRAADIEERARKSMATLVKKAEKEVSRIQKRVRQPGAGELAALKKKVNALEKRLAAVERKSKRKAAPRTSRKK